METKEGIKKEELGYQKELWGLLDELLDIMSMNYSCIRRQMIDCTFKRCPDLPLKIANKFVDTFLKVGIKWCGDNPSFILMRPDEEPEEWSKEKLRGILNVKL